MSDQEFIEKIASYWIDLGGDAAGVQWVWRKLMDEIERQEKEGSP